MPVIAPLIPVEFAEGKDIFRNVWQVTLQEDGSLVVMPIGRRAGRILIEPSSHMSVTLTTTKLIVDHPR